MTYKIHFDLLEEILAGKTLKQLAVDKAVTAQSIRCKLQMSLRHLSRPLRNHIYSDGLPVRIADAIRNHAVTIRRLMAERKIEHARIAKEAAKLKEKYAVEGLARSRQWIITRIENHKQAIKTDELDIIKRRQAITQLTAILNGGQSWSWKAERMKHG